MNEGLIKWKEGRKKWLAAATSGQKRPRRRPPRVDDEVILETIFAKPTGWLLPHPVPLAHMVDCWRTSGPTRNGGAADLLHANQNTRRLFPARRTIVYVFTLGRHLDRRRLRLLRRRQQDLLAL